MLQRTVWSAFPFNAVRPVAVKLYWPHDSSAATAVELQTRTEHTPQHRYAGTTQLSSPHLIPAQQPNFPSFSATHDLYTIFLPTQIGQARLAASHSMSRPHLCQEIAETLALVTVNVTTEVLIRHTNPVQLWWLRWRHVSCSAEAIALTCHEKASCRCCWLACLR